ncbi:hypothetical protein [Paenibacillus elgii]|uniref:hypothetical protein n=1 Tax=Paenibacillus elgii TaxID=189691 RepID=UPI0020407071|nr:hypothetical protein [Paenibacillus elgii]MCM3269275.1 hypothetical protein [Paenibacillus elgii]
MLKIYLSNISSEFMIKANKQFAEFIDYFYFLFEDMKEDVNYDISGDVFPKFYYRKNKLRCHDIITDLYDWSHDDFIHELKPIYEFAVFHIIIYCQEAHEDALKEGYELFKGLHQLEVNDGEGISEEFDIINGGYTDKDIRSFDFFIENLFQDFDFLYIGDYYNLFKQNPIEFLDKFGINFEDYIELFPEDIQQEVIEFQQQYQQLVEIDNRSISENIENVNSFHAHINLAIDRFKNAIENRGLYKLFWNDDSTKKDESIAQIILLNYIYEYCFSHNIDISREVNIGRGPVDFKLSHGMKFRILIEVKYAHNKKFWNGLTKQLPKYMEAEDINEGIFIIVVFKEADYKNITEIENKINGINQKKNINLRYHFIDVVPNKLSASKL